MLTNNPWIKAFGAPPACVRGVWLCDVEVLDPPLRQKWRVKNAFEESRSVPPLPFRALLPRALPHASAASSASLLRVSLKDVEASRCLEARTLRVELCLDRVGPPRQVDAQI